MSSVPETVHTESRRVWCDGATDIRAGAALGHPRVYMEIDQRGYVDCGYCDRRFVLKGEQERGINEVMPGDLPGAGDAVA
ncbi:zinc-finger domain-containing protein [Novosphingobium aquimarinum]|uniref:zinc-finger domain-containing protein n=1 Tax=Novosphingobium aquimarinum TaxID=2682494 RepID=UPI0012EBBBB7|nr:zinc-finger domain-containing protein [Novosphingobium aquimarinum]